MRTALRIDAQLGSLIDLVCMLAGRTWERDMLVDLLASDYSGVVARWETWLPQRHATWVGKASADPTADRAFWNLAAYQLRDFLLEACFPGHRYILGLRKAPAPDRDLLA
jgi:hypothetical protein